MTTDKRNIFPIDVAAWEADTRRHKLDTVAAWLRICIASDSSEPRGVVTDTVTGFTALIGSPDHKTTERILDEIGTGISGKKALGDVEQNLDATYTVHVRRHIREEEKRKKVSESVRRTRMSDIAVPEEMQAHGELCATWAAWLAYRRQERKKPVTPTAQTRQLAKIVQEMRECGLQSAIDMIAHSMDNDYTGLFTHEERGVRRMAAHGKNVSPLDRAHAAASFFKDAE